MVRILGEKSCNKMVEATFNVVRPIKNKLSKPDCKVHIFLQNNALESLYANGYYQEYMFFNRYINYINKGVVWADQDLRSYCHFYDPIEDKGLTGSSDNALTLAEKYYKYSLYHLNNGDIERSMVLLGATCHLIQDVNVPQHAMCELLNNHIQFETYVKQRYLKINRFKTLSEPIYFDNIKDYIIYNSLTAINTNHMYENIKNLNVRFYLIAEKSLKISQQTTAGVMLFYFQNICMQK